MVTLDGTGSSDPDSDSLSFQWSEGGTPLGTGASLSVGLTTGSHTITLTVTDPSSASSQDTVIVNVVDSTPPTITCPANVTVANDAGQCQSSLDPGLATASDLCSGSLVPVGVRDDSKPLSDPYPVGTTTITWTAIDAAGHVSTCSQTVVVTDSDKPTLTCPANLSQATDAGECSAVVNFPVPTASDNCGSATVVCSPASGSTFPKGVTTVTCTATDGAGNTQTCSFTVTIGDAEPPTITCPANILQSTETGQCSAVVNYPAPTPTDNCPGVTVSCSPPSGSTFPKGATTVTCTATDGSGNTATCSFTVTVNDSEKPTIICPSNITVSAESLFGAIVSYTVTASDNCPGVMTNCTPASGSVFPLGTTTVNCTATDASGNTATCSFTATVVVPPSTASAKVTGGGSILVAGEMATFGMVEISDTDGQLKGNLTYQDPIAGLTLKSTQITALAVNGTHARIFGKATINGAGSYDFVVDVDDLAEPGANVDQFKIQVGTGYSAGGTVLDGGNVQIHK